MRMIKVESSKMKIIILCLFSFLTAFSQEGKLDRADKNYQRLGYIKASKIYQKVADKGYRSAELFEKLGNTYYFNAQYEKALHWYDELFSMEQEIRPVYYLRYAQSLQASGKSKKARKHYDRYHDLLGNAEDWSQSERYLEIIEKNSGRYTLKNLNLNTSGVDFGIAEYKDGLVFASTRDTGTIGKRKSAWDGLSFLDLYSVSYAQGSIDLNSISKIKGKANTIAHESTPVFTADGQTMYFTRNNNTSEKGGEKSEIVHLKIYRAQFIDGKWKEIEDLSINGEKFSTAHPALNTEEDRLYFVSDRTESMGATDIFVVEIRNDGSLGRVENLGDKINTSGRESFPFITERNELYFSSDGHFGLGGYDVFYVQLEGIQPSGGMINVGKPMNSEMDDVAFSINTLTHKGFVSSNRPGGHGRDDIYSFTETTDIRDVIYSRIYGRVTDADTGKPIANASIKIFANMELVKQIFTDSSGDYATEVNRNTVYTIRAEKEAYSTDEAVSETGLAEQEINFELKRDLYALFEGQDIGKALGIKNIFFDFDKWNIRPDAEVELQKILAVLEEYPRLHIDIRSHTDSRGNDAYNEILSDKRANSTMQYLVGQGIDNNRLSAKGYGESQLVNRCSNGVNCTAAEHQENRRSEFIIKVK